MPDVHKNHPHKQPFVGKTITPIPRQTWLPKTGKKKKLGEKKISPEKNTIIINVMQGVKFKVVATIKSLANLKIRLQNIVETF